MRHIPGSLHPQVRVHYISLFSVVGSSSHSVSKAVLKLQFTSAYLCRYSGLVNFTHIKMDIPDNTKLLRVMNNVTFAVYFY